MSIRLLPKSKTSKQDGSPNYKLPTLEELDQQIAQAEKNLETMQKRLDKLDRPPQALRDSLKYWGQKLEALRMLKSLRENENQHDESQKQ